MVTGEKRIHFPKPGATKEKEDVLIVGKDRMLAHYNQDHPDQPKPASRITSKIVEHTEALAIKEGWAAAAVAKDAVTGHTTGMVLLRDKPQARNADPKVIDVEAVPVKKLGR